MKKFLQIILAVILINSKLTAQINTEINFGTAAPDNGFCIRQTVEGNYIIAGSTESLVNFDEDVYLSLLDSNGAIIWTKIIGGVGNESADNIRQTPDSGFIIAGVTDSYGVGNTDFYLIRTDKNGDTLWTKTFGGDNYDYGFSVENTFDGGFIISGQSSSTIDGIANIYLVKTTATGDSVWGHSFRFGDWAGAISLHQTPDSGYVIFGDFENGGSGLGGYDLYWMKLDALGNIVSTKTFEDPLTHDYAESMRSTFDGGFIIGSEKEAMITSDKIGSTIIRIDSNLDTLWSRRCVYGMQYSVRDIVQSCDSGFIATGYIIDTTSLANIMFLTKFSGNGDSLWSRYFYGLSSAVGYSIDNSRDDSIVICGVTIDSLGGETDVYFVKSENGGCGGVQCTPVITMQPMDSSVFENMSATFMIQAAIQSISFLWQVDSTGIFLDLNDGGIYSGTTTNTLQITGSQLAMDGYRYRCIVESPTNCSDTSTAATLNVSIDPNVGIGEIDGTKISLFPNPSTSEIRLTGSIPERLLIFNIYGKSIAEYNSVQHIDITSLSNGIYYLKVFDKTKNEFLVFRFIKN
jgi:hypothetical protein